MINICLSSWWDAQLIFDLILLQKAFQRPRSDHVMECPTKVRKDLLRVSTEEIAAIIHTEQWYVFRYAIQSLVQDGSIKRVNEVGADSVDHLLLIQDSILQTACFLLVLLSLVMVDLKSSMFMPPMVCVRI